MSSQHIGGSREPNKSIASVKKWRIRAGLKWSLGSNAFGRLALSFCFLSAVVLRINARPGCSGMETSEDNGITCDIVRDILDTHNRIRQSIAEGSINAQPPAANMRELYWDSELASGAQNWADQCVFEHSDSKDRKVARFPVGQNIGLMKSTRKNSNITKINFSKQIHSWFDEHNAYKFGAIDAKVLPVVGHYTQLVWATTYLVGCGYSQHKSSNNTIFQFYVCHYGPIGNEIDKSPYIVGNLSCDHSLEVSKTYSNLCGMKDAPASCPKNKDNRIHDDKRNVTPILDDQKFVNDTHSKAQPENVMDASAQHPTRSDNTYIYSIVQQDNVVLILN